MDGVDMKSYVCDAVNRQLKINRFMLPMTFTGREYLQLGYDLMYGGKMLTIVMPSDCYYVFINSRNELDFVYIADSEGRTNPGIGKLKLVKG